MKSGLPYALLFVGFMGLARDIPLIWQVPTLIITILHVLAGSCLGVFIVIKNPRLIGLVVTEENEAQK